MNLYVTANQNNPVPDYKNGIKILHSKFYNYANYLSEKNLGWYDGQVIETNEQKNLRPSANYRHLKYPGLFSSTSHPSRFLSQRKTDQESQWTCQRRTDTVVKFELCRIRISYVNPGHHCREPHWSVWLHQEEKARQNILSLFFSESKPFHCFIT